MAEVVDLRLFQELDITKNYLVLIHPQTIPHLGLIVRGSYYSLTYKEAEIALNAVEFLKKLDRAKKKIILLEIKKDLKEAESVFGRFRSVDTSKTSCFMPVKSILMPSSDSEMIHELIPELYEAQLIGDSFQLNLENLLNKSGNFELRKYSKEMIFSYIQALKNRDATGKQNSITGH